MRRAACFSRWLSPRDRGVVLDDRLRCDEDDRFLFAIPKDFVFLVFDLIVERLRPGKFEFESSADIFRAHPILLPTVVSLLPSTLPWSRGFLWHTPTGHAVCAI